VDKSALEKKWVAVNNSFEEYRSSGLALMATVIGLSTGGFLGLFRNLQTRPYCALFLVPITFAIVQQLMHYFGQREAANSKFHDFFISQTEVPEDRYLESYIKRDKNLSYSKFHFNVADHLCWISCLSLVLVGVWAVSRFSSSVVSLAIIVILIVFLGFYGWRLRRLILELRRRVY